MDLKRRWLSSFPSRHTPFSFPFCICDIACDNNNKNLLRAFYVFIRLFCWSSNSWRL